MSKKELKPKIRFKGFTNEWNNCKVKNLIQLLPFKLYLKEPEQNGKYEIIQQGNDPIIGYANGTPCGDYENTVVFGDHTLSLYKPKRPFFVATDGVRIIKGADNLNGLYLMYILEMNKPQSEGYKRYFSILTDKDAFFTTDTVEQKSIGEFFDKIDKSIKQSEEKIEKWKNIRTSLLSKIFPKEGKKVPELRFKGFSGEWEEKKLGDIFDYEQPSKYIVESTEYSNNYKTPVLTAGQTFILGYTNETFGIKKANKDNPVIIFDDFMATLHYVDFDFKVKSSALKILSLKNINENDMYFNTMILKSINYIVENHERHWISKFMPMKVMTTTKEEQIKIGELFKRIDKYIINEKNKITKMEILKSTFLNKMFV